MTRPSEQAEYAQLLTLYGYISEEDFATTLVDGRGNADLLAARLLCWILRWFRVSIDGKPRFQGRLFVPSKKLIEEWNVAPKAMRAARHAITTAGLARFVSAQHKTFVAVDWEMVGAAVKASRQRVEKLNSDRPKTASLNSDRPKTASLNDSDRPKTASLNAQTSRKRLAIPPLGSSFPPSSFTEEEEEEEILSEKKPQLFESKPTAPDDYETEARSLIAFGEKHGRRCDGQWSTMAVEAYSDTIALGFEASLVRDAWQAYVTDRGKLAAPLGQWLRGISMAGAKSYDYGSDSFAARYQAAAKRREEAERLAEGYYERARDGQGTFWVRVTADGREPLPWSRGIEDEAEVRRMAQKTDEKADLTDFREKNE